MFRNRIRPESRKIQARAGFTLLELLVVISIIVILMALLAVVGGSMRTNAKIKATKALIQRVSIVLENYKSKMGEYPPDGVDTRVETAEGTTLLSGAALTYAICRPLKLKMKLASGKFKVTEEPPVGLDFKEGDFWRSEDDHDAFEIIDSWSNPLHYDNVEKGMDSYSEQGDTGENWHVQPVEMHDPDPRENSDLVRNTGPQNTNQYDLWASGENAHTIEYDPLETLANFPIISPENK